MAAVLAHGVGSRSDLPIPLDLAMYSAGMAVLVSFAALVVLWRHAKFSDGHGDGIALPAAAQSVIDSPTAACRPGSGPGCGRPGHRRCSVRTAEQHRQPRAVRRLCDAVGRADPGEPAARTGVADREPPSPAPPTADRHQWPAAQAGPRRQARLLASRRFSDGVRVAGARLPGANPIRGPSARSSSRTRASSCPHPCGSENGGSREATPSRSTPGCWAGWPRSGDATTGGWPCAIPCATPRRCTRSTAWPPSR